MFAAAAIVAAGAAMSSNQSTVSRGLMTNTVAVKCSGCGSKSFRNWRGSTICSYCRATVAIRQPPIGHTSPKNRANNLQDMEFLRLEKEIYLKQMKLMNNYHKGYQNV